MSSSEVTKTIVGLLHVQVLHSQIVTNCTKYDMCNILRQVCQSYLDHGMIASHNLAQNMLTAATRMTLHSGT